MEVRDIGEQATLEGRRSKRLHYGFVIIVMGALTVLGALGLARYPYSLILPPMKESLGFSYTETGMLFTGFFSGYIVFAVVTSVLASKFGSRIVISTSMIIAGLGLIATGQAQGFTMALVPLLITGAATSGGYVQAMTLPAAWFTPRRRGMAAGGMVSGMGVGAVASGFLLPSVISSGPDTGWRYSWMILGAAVLAIGVAAAIWVRNRPAEKGLQPYGPAEPGGNVPAPAGRLGKIYTSPLLWHTSMVYLLYGFTNIVIMTFFSAHLTKEVGLDTAEAGRAYAVLGISTIISGTTWGFVSDRLGRKYGLAISLLLLGIGAAALGGVHDLPLIYVSGALFGVCLTGAPSILAAASGDYFGARMAAPALGFLTVLFGVGQAIGPSVAGYLADLTGSFAVPFYLAGAASVVGAIGSLLLRK